MTRPSQLMPGRGCTALCAGIALFALLNGGIAATTAAAPDGSGLHDWPQWLGPNRDGVWRETGILEEFPPAGPTLRWRTEIGAGYAGPAVSEGKVYLTDRRLTQGSKNPENAFQRGLIHGVERVLCLNEADGQILWTHEYDCPYDVSYPAGPRATPVVHEGKVYTLGTEGHLFCLDANTGKVIWSREFKKEFGVQSPMWGFSAHPLIDGRKLICMVRGPGSTVVAFDKDDGQEIWRALSANEPGYCPPMIYEAGGARQLIIWHPESINSLEPETGKVHWSEPFTARSGLTISTPRQHGDRLFITAFYNGPMMLRLAEDRPAASVVWRGKSNSEKNTDGLHSIMSTPWLEDDYIYGVCSYGQLRCLNATTGERIWETFEATTGEKPERWANAFIVKNGNRFFLPNEKGDLIIARLSPAGYEEISRARLLEPTNLDPRRPVVWSHPAFANRSIYARNDREIVCYSLALAWPDLEGRSHTPLRPAGKKASVLFFTLPDCPVANAFAPEINRIVSDYAAREIEFCLVQVDPDLTAAQAKEHAAQFGFHCPVLLDQQHQLVKATGATMTPEAVVISPAGAVVYRGRINNLFADYGKRRAKPTRHDLRDALEAILQDEPIAHPWAPPVGCFIPDLPKP